MAVLKKIMTKRSQKAYPKFKYRKVNTQPLDAFSYPNISIDQKNSRKAECYTGSLHLVRVRERAFHS